eukprot:snap_masked-scaffold_3-processed-gene-5.9-mRNA-1 protein AED:1.00 eAED:1.00 QI:0/0/0/0/1/1/2/0/69
MLEIIQVYVTTAVHCTLLDKLWVFSGKKTGSLKPHAKPEQDGGWDTVGQKFKGECVVADLFAIELLGVC